jgi:hypothetical protein
LPSFKDFDEPSSHLYKTLREWLNIKNEKPIEFWRIFELDLYGYQVTCWCKTLREKKFKYVETKTRCQSTSSTWLKPKNYYLKLRFLLNQEHVPSIILEGNRNRKISSPYRWIVLYIFSEIVFIHRCCMLWRPEGHSKSFKKKHFQQKSALENDLIRVPIKIWKKKYLNLYLSSHYNIICHYNTTYFFFLVIKHFLTSAKNVI